MKAMYLLVAAILISGYCLVDKSGDDEGYIYKEIVVNEGETIYGNIAKVASCYDNINEVTSLALDENGIEYPGAVRPGTKIMVRLKKVDTQKD